MNIPLLAANLLVLLAFFIHTFMGDRELQLIKPDNDTLKQEKWTMARAGWHWLSLDLLLATIALALVNFTNYLNDKLLILNILVIYFVANAVTWAFTVSISDPFPKRYLKLGQWLLLTVISLLIYWGRVLILGLQ
jgi:hypothetical protein